MGKIVFYFENGNAFPGKMKEEIQDGLYKILNLRYGQDISIIENQSISEAIDSVEGLVDYFITLDVSPKIEAKCISQIGKIFIAADNEYALNFANSYNLNSVDYSMDVSGMHTIYTENKFGAPIHMVFREDYITEHADSLTIVMNLSDVLISLMKLKRVNVFGRIEKPEVTYRVIDKMQKVVMEIKDKEQAIKMCNQYNGAIVKNSNGIQVHISTFGKIDPMMTKKTMAAPQVESKDRIPIHTVQRMTRPRRF